MTKIIFEDDDGEKVTLGRRLCSNRRLISSVKENVSSMLATIQTMFKNYFKTARTGQTKEQLNHFAARIKKNENL